MLLAETSALLGRRPRAPRAFALLGECAAGELVGDLHSDGRGGDGDLLRNGGDLGIHGEVLFAERTTSLGGLPRAPRPLLGERDAGKLSVISGRQRLRLATNLVVIVSHMHMHMHTQARARE